jgi:hypothetical protein
VAQLGTVRLPGRAAWSGALLVPRYVAQDVMAVNVFVVQSGALQSRLACPYCSKSMLQYSLQLILHFTFHITFTITIALQFDLRPVFMP